MTTDTKTNTIVELDLYDFLHELGQDDDLRFEFNSMIIRFHELDLSNNQIYDCLNDFMYEIRKHLIERY